MTTRSSSQRRPDLLRSILLTRDSSIQRWCARQLSQHYAISSVVFESGLSFPPAGTSISATRLRRFASQAIASPFAGFGRIYNRLRWKVWYGDVERHDNRLLGRVPASTDLPDVHHVPSINSREARALISDLSPNVVLVFGTGVIGAETMRAAPQAQWINMHWGWSPDYRAEGIVSALALEGPAALGVTIHRLSSKIDGGDILAQRRITVDRDDNFYSIGLKLGIAGTDLFLDLCRKLQRGDVLSATPQDISRGREFSSAYMRAHPGLYRRAWRNLKMAAP